MYRILFFDGYISNCDKVCKQLSISLASYINKTMCQQSILLEGYKKWGEDLPFYLNGYFSFAIEDTIRNQIFGARDRFGAIPFYYAIAQKNLYCDCSIEKVIKESNMKKELNEYALQAYLTFSFVPGKNTFYKNVLKLMPGSSIVFCNGEVIIKKYHHFERKILNDYTLNEYDIMLKEVIKNSLRNKESDDGAFFLSSGVDSNYLFALSKYKESYTVGSDDVEFDESTIAQINARHFGKNCNILTLNKDMFLYSILEATKYMEQPIGTASTVAFMNGCKEVVKKFKVCFTGEGADELFAGYEIYKKSSMFGEGFTYLGKTHIFEEGEKKLILKNYMSDFTDRQIIESICPRDEKMENLTYMMDVDIKTWLEADSFMNTYKMSRAFGLEVRMPFVDENVFELAYSIPEKYKIKDKYDKFILRKASEEILPKEISFYRKRGFVIPIRKWLLDDDYINEFNKTLSNEAVKEFLNMDNVNTFFMDFLKGDQRKWRKIWAIYSFAKWYQLNF